VPAVIGPDERYVIGNHTLVVGERAYEKLKQHAGSMRRRPGENPRTGL
jgi:hypothetical protein